MLNYDMFGGYGRDPVGDSHCYVSHVRPVARGICGVVTVANVPAGCKKVVKSRNCTKPVYTNNSQCKVDEKDGTT